jgi:hypothetical protein
MWALSGIPAVGAVLQRHSSRSMLLETHSKTHPRIVLWQNDCYQPSCVWVTLKRLPQIQWTCPVFVDTELSRFL